MTQPSRSQLEREEERRNRERALDETLEDSFPASDPLSSDPNPAGHGENDRKPEEEDDQKPVNDRRPTTRASG
jgi:hypothetical protein